MEKRRSTRRRRSSERVLMILLVAVVLIGCAVGGTIAYFTDTTDPITNTFTVGEIGNLELTETTANNPSIYDGKYVIVPGVAITKDPTITYTPAKTGNDKELNVGAYIFVEVSGGSWIKDATDNYMFSVNDGAMTWTVNSTDWTHLQGNIYYHVVEANTDAVFTSKFITGDSIAVDGVKVTNANIAAVNTAANDLVFTAYAIQKEGFDTAAAAWAALQTP